MIQHDEFDPMAHAIGHGVMRTPDGQWTGCCPHLHAVPTAPVILDPQTP